MRTPPLSMTCAIARPAPGTQDSFGQPNSAPNVATGVRCCWWSGENAWTLKVDLSGATAVDQEHIIFARGQNVQAGDRITTVVDHLGATVFSSTDYRVVEHVTVQRNHLYCTLRYGKSIGGRA